MKPLKSKLSIKNFFICNTPARIIYIPSSIISSITIKELGNFNVLCIDIEKLLFDIFSSKYLESYVEDIIYYECEILVAHDKS
jgi:hypothetical protein